MILFSYVRSSPLTSIYFLLPTPVLHTEVVSLVAAHLQMELPYLDLTLDVNHIYNDFLPILISERRSRGD
jgi:hypothetical protein